MAFPMDGRSIILMNWIEGVENISDRCWCLSSKPIQSALARVSGMIPTSAALYTPWSVKRKGGEGVQHRDALFPQARV